MLLLIWTDLQSGNVLCFLKWYVRIFYPSFGHVENLALFFIYIALTMFLKSLEDFVTGLFFFFFMAVTSHKNYLFIPSGFPLPPVWFGSNSRFFFFDLYGKRKPPWAKSLQSAEAALCLQRLRYKTPKWLMFVTHIFLADVITKENM